MTFEEFNQIRTTEEEQLLAKACHTFGVDPSQPIYQGIDNMIRHYKALIDYEERRYSYLKQLDDDIRAALEEY